MRTPVPLLAWVGPILARRSVFAATLGLLVGTILAWQLASTGDFRVDDALITFSYSKNLALGNGPVYSHDVRVEGYSNFLWMLLVAGGLAVLPDLDVFLLARLLNVPFLVLLFWATYSLARQTGSRAWAAVALLLVASCSDLAAALLSGLETVSYTALVTAGIALYCRRESLASAPGAVLSLTLAALMRIDGIVPLLAVLAFDAARRWIAGSLSLRPYARWVFPGFGAYAAWFIWRWSYYGDILPSTYYAKQAIPIAVPGRGWDYVHETFTAWGVPVTVPFLAVGILFGRSLRTGLIAFLCLLHIVYVIRVGGDWMPFGRFLLPVTPLLIVLFTHGAQVVSSWPRDRTLRVGATVLAVGSATLFGVFMDRHAVNTRVERAKIRSIARQMWYLDENLLPASRLMDFVVRPGERLVSDFTGAFGYFTRASVIDMWGLVNMTIARRGTTQGVNPLFGKTCPACYPELDPDYFHVNVPMIRPADAFPDHRAVIDAVWQSDTIGRYLDFDHEFASGRIIDTRSRRGLFFLERRRPGKRLVPRQPAPYLVVDYPFEPGGTFGSGP